VGEDFRLRLDTSEAKEQLAELDEAREHSQDSINSLLSAARTTYMITSNITRAAGGSISTIFDAVITTGLASISILSSIYTAYTMGGPIGWIQAGIGFASLGILIASVSAAQAKQSQTESQLRAANMALMGVNNLIGDFHFS